MTIKELLNNTDLEVLEKMTDEQLMEYCKPYLLPEQPTAFEGDLPGMTVDVSGSEEEEESGEDREKRLKKGKAKTLAAAEREAQELLARAMALAGLGRK